MSRKVKKPVMMNLKNPSLQIKQSLHWFGVRKQSLRPLRLAQGNAKAELLDSREFSYRVSSIGIEEVANTKNETLTPRVRFRRFAQDDMQEYIILRDAEALDQMTKNHEQLQSA